MDLLRGSYGETGIMDFDLISLRSLSSNNRTYRSMACTKTCLQWKLSIYSPPSAIWKWL